MKGAAGLGTRLLAWVSWIVLAAAVLATIASFFCLWGVNAAWLGARDAGIAIFLASLGAVILIVSMYAAPILALLGLIVLFVHRDAALRLLAAGAVASIPLVVLTLLEAYPVDKRGRSHDDSMWFGAKSMYDAVGFTEVARRKPSRPVVRIRPE